MAKDIVDDGTGSGQSEKKYTFSFELTKPQHTRFWEWLTQSCYMTEEVFYGVECGRLEEIASKSAKRWCELEKEIAPLVIAGKLTPIEKETVNPTTV